MIKVLGLETEIGYEASTDDREDAVVEKEQIEKINKKTNEQTGPQKYPVAKMRLTN